MLPSQPVAACWNDGQSAVQHSVIVYFREFKSELRICGPSDINDMNPPSVWDAHGVRVISGSLSGNKQETVYLGEQSKPGERLIITEKTSLDAFRAWLEKPQKQRKSRVRKRWLAATAGVWLFFIALFLGSSTIFGLIAQGIPRNWEEKLGKSSQETVIKTLSYLPGNRGICKAGSDDKGLRNLMERLSEAAPIKGYSFNLTVLDADFVNAFALPGGYVVVSTGLIQACESPDELAGVLAHEMAHVTERHGTARLLRHYTWTGFLKMITGNESVTGNLAQLLITSSFDRDDERSADLLGAARLARAGINPLAMADFFGRLQKEEPDAGSRVYGYIASHPNLGERKEYIRRSLGMQQPLGTGNGTLSESGVAATDEFTPAMDGASWSRLRSVCRVSQKDKPAPKTPDSGKPAAPSKAPAEPRKPEPSKDTNPPVRHNEFDSTALLER